MAVTILSLGGQPYRQVIQSGNQVFYADVSPEKGGGGTAPEPYQLLLGALGACTNMTLQMYAGRKGWDLRDVTTTVEESKVRPEGQNAWVPQLTKTIAVRGDLSPEQLADLKRVAERCPVNRLIVGEKTMVSRLNHVV